MKPFLSCARVLRTCTAAVLLLGAGCASKPLALPEVGPRFVPSNVYKAVQKLPPDLRRVAVLPLTVHGEDRAATERIGILSAIFDEELQKLRRFEVVTVSEADLRRWIGRPRVSASETLPPDLLARIRTNLVADGVLFVRVHSFRPYPPVSLGWDARLVTVSTGQTLWSIDEAFDAGQADVARAARDYFRDHHTGPSELADPQADLRSPAHFTRYAAQAALATLPAR
jgi:hypothetical protein